MSKAQKLRYLMQLEMKKAKSEDVAQGHNTFKDGKEK
jgi:hypothetical protein